jgi:hypothetical protein
VGGQYSGIEGKRPAFSLPHLSAASRIPSGKIALHNGSLCGVGAAYRSPAALEPACR